MALAIAGPGRACRPLSTRLLRLRWAWALSSCQRPSPALRWPCFQCPVRISMETGAVAREGAGWARPRAGSVRPPAASPSAFARGEEGSSDHDTSQCYVLCTFTFLARWKAIVLSLQTELRLTQDTCLPHRSWKAGTVKANTYRAFSMPQRFLRHLMYIKAFVPQLTP